MSASSTAKLLVPTGLRFRLRSAFKPKTPLWHLANGTLTNADMRRHYVEWELKTRPFALLKPAKYLGAPWISSFVALRRSVSLCENCHRRYKGWWKRYEYTPVWDPKELTDCDGCGGNKLFCTGFYPSEAGRMPWAKVSPI